jgi:hypothetical protein
MSVLFLPPPPGAASIPDASETVSGKIRIATSAEATTGTNDLTAMTPAKVKTVVDAAVVGGVTYKGTFDTSAPVDLSNALQGDLYIISVAGSYQGQTWAVGDHLLINADMGGTLDPAKIDKVDNTDAVTSVAGRTGAVVLSSADISGLATVATSGAYSDLSGTPTLATVATTGAYSDLTGTPTLGTAAAEDVGTAAGNVVQLNGSAQLPAIDGSLLTNISASVAALDDVGDVDTTGVSTNNVLKYDGANWVDGSVAYTEVTGTPTLGTASAEDVGTAAGNVVQLDGSARLPAVDGSLLTNVSASVADLDDIGNVDTTGVSTNNVLLYDGANWVDGSVAYADVTGTPTLATVATTGAYSDLSGTPSLATVATTGAYSDLTGTPTLGTAAAEDVGTAAGNVVQLNGSAQLPAIDGSLLTNVSASVADLDDIGNVDTTGVSTNNVLKYDGANWVDGSVAYTEVTGTPTLATVATSGAYSDLSGTPTLATVATSGAYSDLTGTPTLATVATTGAYSDLTGTPTLATVATSGAYSDLTGTPTLGTAAAEDVGTAAGNVVQLDGTAKLPAVDGSQLTNLPTAGYPALTSASPSSTYTISTSTGFMEIYLLNPSAAIAVNIPAPGTVAAGYRYSIKNRSANSITLTPASGNIDGVATFVLNVQNSAVTLVSDQSNWYII